MILSDLEERLLEKYEDRMRTSRSNYVRNLSHIDITKLVEIYNKLTNGNYKMLGNCSVCQLNFFKALDKVYTKYKEQKELELNTDIQEVTKEKVTKIKRKKTKKDETN